MWPPRLGHAEHKLIKGPSHCLVEQRFFPFSLPWPTKHDICVRHVLMSRARVIVTISLLSLTFKKCQRHTSEFLDHPQPSTVIGNKLFSIDCNRFKPHLCTACPGDSSTRSFLAWSHLYVKVRGCNEKGWSQRRDLELVLCFLHWVIIITHGAFLAL